MTTKPATSRTSTGLLPQEVAKARAVSTVSSLEVMARMTSTRPIIGAGLKKWMPHTWPGRSVTTAISTTGSVEVFVARMAWGAQILSSSAKSSFLTVRSSSTDSTTMSQSASSLRSVTPRTRARAASRSASAELALLDLLVQRLLEALDHPVGAGLRPAAEDDLEPFLAATSAMPEPMVPEPTIPTRLMVHGLPLAVAVKKGAGQATGCAVIPSRHVGSIPGDGASGVRSTGNSAG